MKFEPHQFYHIYNQGNNRQQLFFDNRNYRYFISLIQKLVLPHCNLMAYCLMPNHFHLMVYTNEKSVRPKQVGGLLLTELSNGIRMLQSSYTAAVNKERKESGSKFRQKAKAKLIESDGHINLQRCFHYIHHNPLKAKLVYRMEDWPFSSFNEFTYNEQHPICDISLALSLLQLDEILFYKESYGFILDDDWEFFDAG